ncbi:DUF4435 domain-containing protein [Chromobacterium violaceum]|uniref:DUF4435 domain-containing protein n=1 Tax=Chromobacterium violaceum TaxID=536 RepID=UPI001B334A96|nr:DUF4435 domain-containing protein [Chromobacterium violaceum]MBP4051010.1 DUF4435 domain-containing protein [Chromobacterium violaceum]
MDSIEYSNDAVNVRSAFFEAECMVFVEGDEDIFFWETIFKEFPMKVKIESVGGAPQLDIYIYKIYKGEINAIAARDSDHLKYKLHHKNIIYTKGYSIENTIYTAETIRGVARTSLRYQPLKISDVSKWLINLETDMKELIALDRLNFQLKKGVKFFPEKCQKLMLNGRNGELCPQKINEISNNARIAIGVNDSAMEKVKQSVRIENLRGHFLASSVLSYISNLAKKLSIKITMDSSLLYAAALSYMDSKWSQHSHYSYYTAKLSKIEHP